MKKLSVIPMIVATGVLIVFLLAGCTQTKTEVSMVRREETAEFEADTAGEEENVGKEEPLNDITEEKEEAEIQNADAADPAPEEELTEDSSLQEQERSDIAETVPDRMPVTKETQTQTTAEQTAVSAAAESQVPAVDAGSADTVVSVSSEKTQAATVPANAQNSVSPSAAETAESKAVTEHIHVWEPAEVIQEQTCTEDGSQYYTCDCGCVKTVVIPATGMHTWVEQTEQVWVIDQEAYDEEVCTGNQTYIQCNVCGALSETGAESTAHYVSTNHGGTHLYVQGIWETVHHEASGHYETATTGYTCAVCGIQK